MGFGTMRQGKHMGLAREGSSGLASGAALWVRFAEEGKAEGSACFCPLREGG